MALVGVGIGLLMLLIIIPLVYQADLVFRNAFDVVLERWFNLKTIMIHTLMAVLGAFWIYCLVCSACLNNIEKKLKEKRNRESIIAVACMGMISLIYILFSGIQIVFLFLGQGQLPVGTNFSEYARQGFFQLLFVVCMNLVMVLFCLKHVKKSKILDFILMVICLCTYVMVASSAYRMLLYIGEYNLTFLRIWVLWFLALLAVLMLGVVIMILKHNFPLFKYCLAVISILYLGFSFSKPDLIIAEYNVAHIDDMDINNLLYLKYSLSADAAPAIHKLVLSQDVLKYFDSNSMEEFREYYKTSKLMSEESNMSLRTYNFSYGKAIKIFQ